MAYIPVVPFVGDGGKKYLPLTAVLNPNVTYFESKTLKQLDSPPKFGDICSNGEPFRVGVLDNNKIFYHLAPSVNLQPSIFHTLAIRRVSPFS
jgi:hypothetical protein